MEVVETVSTASSSVGKITVSIPIYVGTVVKTHQAPDLSSNLFVATCSRSRTKHVSLLQFVHKMLVLLQERFVQQKRNNRICYRSKRNIPAQLSSFSFIFDTSISNEK